MAIGGQGRAAQATMALLKLAKEIADAVVGDADQATVRAVFDRLCLETDMGPEPDAEAQPSASLH